MAELADLNVSGPSTFGGVVSVPEPTADAHAATKAYVDAALGGGGASGFDEDGNGDLMPSSGAPGVGGDFEADGNGDLQPTA